MEFNRRGLILERHQMSRSQQVMWVTATASWVLFFIGVALGFTGTYAAIEMITAFLQTPVTVGGLLLACAIVLAITKLPR